MQAVGEILFSNCLLDSSGEKSVASSALCSTLQFDALSERNQCLAQRAVVCVHLLKLGLLYSEALIINQFSNPNFWFSSNRPLCKIDIENGKSLWVLSSPRAPEKRGFSNRGVLGSLLAERQENIWMCLHHRYLAYLRVWTQLFSLWYASIFSWYLCQKEAVL